MQRLVRFGAAKVGARRVVAALGACALVALSSFVLTSAAFADAATQPPGLDHFACYHADPAPSGPAFTPPPVVGLHDEFGTDPQVTVIPQPNQLCNPADKVLPSGAVTPMQNPNAHLVCWPIVRQATRPILVNVTNQFGAADLSVHDAQQLCVPSWKWIVGTTPPPMPGDTPPGLDHFECYQADESTTAPPFPNKPPFVTVNDEFGQQRHLTLGAVVQLCNPVEKTVPGAPGPTPITNPDAHLVCFATTPDPPANVVVNAVDQFGQGALAVSGGSPLCLPSFKTIVQDPQLPEVAWAIGLPLSAFALIGGWLFIQRRRTHATI
jgi:hypothetical protein